MYIEVTVSALPTIATETYQNLVRRGLLVFCLYFGGLAEPTIYNCVLRRFKIFFDFEKRLSKIRYCACGAICPCTIYVFLGEK